MRVLVSVLFTGVLALCLCRGTHEACEESNVHVELVPGHRKLSTDVYLNFRVDYGVNTTIFCTGNYSKNLHMGLITGKFITTDRGTQDMEIVNLTTAKLILVNPAIDHYQYTCTDVETTCAERFIVSVVPVITIVSPNVRLSGDNTYFVPVNEDYEVVCYGNPTLSITSFLDKLHAISVNDNTIKLNKQKVESTSECVLYCEHRANGDYAMTYLYFYPAPAAKNFACIQIDRQINCTWSPLSTSVDILPTTFTLFYIDKYGNSLLLNAYKVRRTNTWRSEWGFENVMQQGLEYHNDMHFVLQACKRHYCVNETYPIDHTSIIKSASPVGLEAVETGSQKAAVIWTYKEDYPMDYNIIYQLPEMEWIQQLKASSQENCEGRDCKIELKLPCPRVLYELKIYAKSTTAPQKPEYWSDPATITFHSDSQDTAADPMCYEKPESIVNKYVGEQKSKEFHGSTAKNLSALHRKIQSMKRKLDTIKNNLL